MNSNSNMIAAAPSTRGLALLCLLGPCMVVPACAGPEALSDGLDPVSQQVRRTAKDGQGQLVMTGKLVLEDKFGRERIVLDPETGIVMLDEFGKAQLRLIVGYGDANEGAVVEIGLYERPKGILPSMVYHAVSIGYDGKSSYCILRDGTGNIALTPTMGEIRKD